MNVKNFLFILSFLFITQVINTAELTIYNQLSKPVPIKVVWLSWQNKDVSKNYMIAPNSPIHVSTGGAYPFRRLLWVDKTPTFTGGGYAIDIPSSRMMLNGQIYIGTNGEYMINFDQNGVSQFIHHVALPVKPAYIESESME